MDAHIAETYTAEIKLELQVDSDFLQQIMDEAYTACTDWANTEKPSENTLRVTEKEIKFSHWKQITSKVLTHRDLFEACLTVLHPSFIVSFDAKDALQQAMIDNNPESIDFDMADLVIQAAMFDKLIYG